MEVPRRGVELLAYATARAASDPSHICGLHRSSWQRRIIDPLSGAGDGARGLVVPGWIRFHCAMSGTLEGAFRDRD